MISLFARIARMALGFILLAVVSIPLIHSLSARYFAVQPMSRAYEYVRQPEFAYSRQNEDGSVTLKTSSVIHEPVTAFWSDFLLCETSAGEVAKGLTRADDAALKPRKLRTTRWSFSVRHVPQGAIRCRSCGTVRSRLSNGYFLAPFDYCTVGSVEMLR